MSGDGSNIFDTLFVAAADVAYRPGPVYAALTGQDVFALAWTMLLAAIVGAGLVRRERRGIGFEGVAVTVVYVLGFAGIALW